MNDTPLHRRRSHLEALLLARVLLDPSTADYVDERCLSPAAFRLFDAALENPTQAASAGLLSVAEPSDDKEADAFCMRLATRVERLTVRDLGFLDRPSLLSFINNLPRMRSGRPQHRPITELLAPAPQSSPRLVASS